MRTKAFTKLLALSIALIMVLGVLPLSVFADSDTESTVLKNRIVHLDCGRKYFSVDYIKGVIDAMYENAFNQLELAFGNGGLRFVLDESGMDIKSGSSTLHDSEKVISAIKEGNKKFYDDPNGNVLTEKEMKEIIAYAAKKDIEIVPLLNMPGHMDGLLSSSLFSGYKLSGSDGSLNLNNSYAVDFGKALLKLYVDWFKENSPKTSHFNFGADEYGQGIRNPYIESSQASVTYNRLINYMNDCAEVIEKGGMTARCFNDFVCYNKRTTCNLYKTVEVCYWSNQWNGSEYNTPDVISAAGYQMINTSQKWYYVPSKSNEYGKDTVLSNFQKYDVTKYQNIKSGYNSDSTTYTEIPVGTTNVGAMFAIWCDTPSVDVSLTDVQELIAAMAAANSNYFVKNTTPAIGDDGNVEQVGDILVAIINKIFRLFLSGNATATWTVDNSDIVEISAISAARTLKAAGTTSQTVENANAIQVKALKKGTATIKAMLDDGTVLETVVSVKDPASEDIELVVDGTESLVIKNKDLRGDYTPMPEGIASVSAEYTNVPGEPKVTKVSSVTSGEAYIIQTSDGKYLTANAGTTTDVKQAAKWTVTGSNDTGYTLKSGSNYLRYNKGLTTTTDSWYATSLYLKPDDGIFYQGYYHYYNMYYNSIGCSPATLSETEKVEETTLTFTGLKPGKATVEIDGITYNIAVSKDEYTVPVTLQVGNNYGLEFKRSIPTDWTLDYTVTDGNGVISFDKATQKVKAIKEGSAKVVVKATKNGVEVGAYTFVFAVSKKDMSAITLPVNLWITNTGVVPTGWSNGTGNFSYTDDAGNRRSIYTLKANYSGVYNKNGIELSSILPEGKAGTAKSWDGNEYDVVYWKSAYHTSENRQSTDGWTNNSHKGISFKYIRYWDDEWAYSADGKEWVPISNVGAGAEDTAKNQVNIWFRQKTTITDEVVTVIVDWGPIEYSANQCLLDFAVKYETGERSPSSFPASGKTMGFDCPTNQTVPLGNGYVVKDTDGTYYRTVYGIAGIETSNYEVYMITVTPSSDSHTTYINKGTTPSTYTYSGTEKIAWAKTDEDRAKYSDLTETSDYKVGGEAFLESVKIYQFQGLLVTYYVRAKQTEDSLTVHYINKSNGDEFYSYNIAVATGTIFKNGIAFGNPQKGYLDNGDVINLKGETQRVSSDLSSMPEISAQYRYSNYECASVERRDGKNVYLYYVFVNAKSYVVDFGLPLKIKLTDLNADLANATITVVTITGATHGKAVYSDNIITYTLNSILDESERLTVTVTGTRGGNTDTVSYNVTVIPASTVYYEDSFVNFTGGAGAASGAKWEPDTDGTTQSNIYQALEELGSKQNPYGYDTAYNNSTKFSMGSAMKVTVSKNMASAWDTYADSAWPTATFTFKGTGFDVISLTDNNSGIVICKVTNSEGKSVYNRFINNYYGYKYVDGKMVQTSVDANALYQLPVIKVKDLAYDTYTVTLTAAYGEVFDKTGDSEYTFWLDAIRVYDPLGEDNENYVKDGEGYPQFIELRDNVVAKEGGFLIEGKVDADITEYKNFGPNHEVYLGKDQSLTFALSTADWSKVASVQLGLKAVDGAAHYIINGMKNNEVQTVSTATDMYYDITDVAKNGGTVVITNTGDNILSLTNVKVTYTTAGNKADMTMTEAQKTQAVEMVRAMFAPAVFEPSRFEAAWSSNNVKAGRRAYLTVKTSTDVNAITVNGETVTTYITRTERKGWGWNATRVTYREFIWSVTAEETADYTVAAVNSEGVASEPVTVTLTVQPKKQQSSWWDRFSRWF